ncbi:MAG: FAD-dependent oxidoreductase, partial [Planctomycetes bacterium]|nr:FAD-dependent oxidoreductase [Planctomycetota bacterium]
PFSPSICRVWEDESLTSVPFSTEQVYGVIKDFRYAASIAFRGGYDAIFIQGYGGYLIDQFMTEKWNARTDEFGGSFENRMRFPQLLIKAIQDVAGYDYPIIFKMTPDHLIEGGRILDEGLRIAKFLEQAGVSAIQIDVGCIDRWYMQIEPMYHQERVKQFAYAAEIKKVVGVPVFTQGKVGDPAEAQAVFEEGFTDFVSLGRPLLADPYWPNKVREGRIDDIRPCICCLEGCIGRIDARRTISCAVNPLCGFENTVRVEKAARVKKVIVVGAGPAGIEAALRCAQRGHEVELWEKQTAIGGLLRPGGSPSFKKELRRLAGYYKTQIDKTPNVRLRLNTEATANSLLEARPDAVVLAVGGRPIIPDLKGVNGKNILLATAALLDQVPTGKKVVVVGGGYVGCETALYLKAQGRQVVLMEMMNELLPGENRKALNPMMLLDMIAEAAIATHTATSLREIGESFVVFDKDGKTERMECDCVVLALGFRPHTQLEDELNGAVEVFTAGDMNQPRKIIDAVWEGFSAAMSV